MHIVQFFCSYHVNYLTIFAVKMRCECVEYIKKTIQTRFAECFKLCFPARHTPRCFRSSLKRVPTSGVRFRSANVTRDCCVNRICNQQ